MTDQSIPISDLFNDPEHAAEYANGPDRFMPGFRSVHRMASILISEHVPPEPHILIHGAGGGLEIEAFASKNSSWTFLGVDPAKPMLDEAKRRLGETAKRVSFVHGTIENVPEMHFDAATSFLTLHFLTEHERQKTVAEIVRRLKPGAPFVAAYCSFPQDPEQKEIWLARHRAFAIASGIEPELAETGRRTIAEELFVLNPETDEAILRNAGLSDVAMFYSAFTWRGWIGIAK